MLGNFVYEYLNAPGVGPMVTAGSPTGRRSFIAEFGLSAPCYYVIDDGLQQEEGWTTTPSAPGGAMTRNVVWTSAAGLSTAPLNFSTTCRVYAQPPASAMVWSDQNNVLQGRNRRLASIGPAIAMSDAMRLDQAGTIAAGLTTQTTSFGPLVVTMPQTPDPVDIKVRSLAPNGAAGLYLRVSIDGGQSFLQGNNEYSMFLLYNSGSTVGTYSTQSTYALLAPSQSTSFPITASINLDPTNRQFNARIDGAGIICLSNGFWNTVGTPTHVVIAFVGVGSLGGLAKASRMVFA